jgi:hypothetical protein
VVTTRALDAGARGPSHRQHKSQRRLFLWDLRETLGDMLADYHYDLITKMVHDRGMGHYGESHEEGRAFIGDGMQVKRSNDVPMSAMWTQKPGVNNDLPATTLTFASLPPWLISTDKTSWQQNR